ncbi:MAG TPA: HAMP domain-containing sensor histidine kinase [Longimicrobiales bacterium]|nr:HAMP domain-containing sensor histidine kinase [Longimicrobiales bacterium]
MLRSRLDQLLDLAAADVGARWLRQRSDLLALADEADVQRLLRSEASDQSLVASPNGTRRISLHDVRGRTRGTLGRSNGEGNTPTLSIDVPLHDRLTGERLGVLRARLRMSDLIDIQSAGTPGAGAVLTAIDPRTGAPLLPLPFDAEYLRGDRFRWGGEEWVVQRRSITEPVLQLVAAAPLGSVAEPFAAAARRGVVALLLVAAAAVALGAVQTGRMTRSLGALAEAADSVARGELQRTVPVTSQDEVGRVADAFNTMTASLRELLRQQSQREAHALLGRFASEIAHEVRNPLTAIRLDLQMMDEHLPPGETVRELQRGALAAIGHLERTVSGVLDLARSGRVQLVSIDLRAPVQAALAAARPVFADRGVLLVSAMPETPLRVNGDAAMLQQMALNILLNAAEASETGGTTQIDARAADRDILLTVTDDGSGIPAAELARVRDPFFSTKASGTGLGLALVERIASAHGGALHIESAVGRGSRVIVRLPASGAT